MHAARVRRVAASIAEDEKLIAKYKKEETEKLKVRESPTILVWCIDFHRGSFVSAIDDLEAVTQTRENGRYWR